MKAALASSTEELKKKRRKIERDYRTLFVEMAQCVFDVSSSDDQKEILQDFSERFHRLRPMIFSKTAGRPL